MIWLKNSTDCLPNEHFSLRASDDQRCFYCLELLFVDWSVNLMDTEFLRIVGHW
ncbi:uncharacterized protein PHALS_05742 [Plasmopara halstedii]|uniref:Uncharacterized protein n=1 Tax=Plasmopara halstedii TaxID=4781 RepID=A0A0N7L449_PLAHL|nr:uncharacterized protein PHALS_05742 [Plasmopara halstedii]CEG37683.1 hypothetical protein PHALS_05742 [Plasmopara halstedii]|eukprot:XP_024574052.1 hypothetical protein PHALS_05742 [Plasmopara halstedii]